MKLEHVAIWTANLERLKDFYVRHFGGQANTKYTNEQKQFSSYFISFGSGARLELMTRTGIPENLNDRVGAQHTGIIHLAFEVPSKAAVEEKAEQLCAAGFPILSGPRRTGDGYYEVETLDPDNNRLEITTVWVD
ncbi:glyoxalase [Segetibacter sp. 3557_3]|uniref:VOC family protein n=1 Tax=Segetibacter sp. 3557_3 TaxID=2547429 RepID=UPI00105914E4|nr:VOC family protein [Segetibacter sp. 3557_3]TDH17929.1 glyoxalase [Segetibacter sp. 3557_3]